jgi:hypothetical protein
MRDPKEWTVRENKRVWDGGGGGRGGGDGGRRLD